MRSTCWQKSPAAWQAAATESWRGAVTTFVMCDETRRARATCAAALRFGYPKALGTEPHGAARARARAAAAAAPGTRMGALRTAVVTGRAARVRSACTGMTACVQGEQLLPDRGGLAGPRVTAADFFWGDVCA